MNISEPFIRRPAMTVLVTVSAIVFGLLAYLKLPVNDLPAVDYPVIQVKVDYPGATPETMANTVATPLERQFMQIPGLELVTSNSGQGHTSFVLQFNLNKPLDGAATDVQSAINQAQGNLPQDLPAPPSFQKTNPNDQPILYIALTSSSVTGGQLYDYANTQVGERISILPGVSQVQVYGTKSAVRIKVDPSKLATRNMTMEELATVVQAGTQYQGAGQFDGPTRTFLIQPKGQLDNAEQYLNLIVKKTGAQPVYLRDVANVVDSVQDERISMHFWARGHDVPTATVVVAVFRQAGSNAVEVAKSVRDQLPLIRTQVPPSVGITPIYDRSRSIVNNAEEVKTTLIIAFVLVVLVIFVFLGRATDTLIPVVALPLSLLLTFICMDILHYSLDNLSLMALTLAIGFLVDDAIVFLENTVSRMEHGETPFQAALHSARQIAFTILAMTLSLAAVFLPLAFMAGLIGRVFREFAVVIIIAIFASGIVSLTVTPMMCSRMLSNRGKGHKKTIVERSAGAVIDWIIKLYGRSLWFFLRHKWISALVWIACMFGTVYYFQHLQKGFLPIGDSGFIRGVLIAQEGSSPEQMRAYQVLSDKIVQSNPDVQMSFTLTASSFLPSTNFGLVLAFLDPANKRPGAPIAKVTGDLIKSLFMGVHGTIPALQPDPVLQIAAGATANQQGKYAFAISGIDQQQVYDTANSMLNQLRPYQGKLFASLNSDLFNHTPQLIINIKRDQASLFNVSVKRIETLLRNAYSQNYLYLIKQPSDQYQLIMEAADNSRSLPENLNLLYIKSDDGAHTMPLNAVAEWHQTIGPQSVNHLNQFTAVTLYFNPAPGANVGDITKIVDDIAKKSIPTGLRAEWQGEAQSFQSTVSSLVILMIVAVFIMYIILGILYESYIHPITVLTSLPVALVGGLACLYYLGMEANLYAFIGMFMLMGIVKKNGIMVVDFANQRLAAGADRVTAIHEASVDRFRPIIMTTLAALMGALPIAYGLGADGASRRPLGFVIVSGLIISQFITLYVTPAIYLYLEQFQEQVLDRIPFFKANRHLHSTESPASAKEEDLEPEEALV